MIELLYFAGLRERLDTEREAIELPAGVADIDGLRQWLGTRGSIWAEEFAESRQLMAAVNQTLVKADTILHDGDEVAFFPPVTGG